MKNLKNNIFLTILVLAFSTNAFADKVRTNQNSGSTPKSQSSVTAGCLPATASTELALNNVRALIHTGGDMWWDLQIKPKYEIPKGSGKTALFAGSIWVGGVDVNGQLKVAAQRFRSGGVDFWPGPLVVDGAERASVTSDVCNQYDKHFDVTRTQVAEFRAWVNAGLQGEEQDPNYTVPAVIKEWPAHGDQAAGYDYYLAPFFDNNEDGTYNWEDGDYPYFDLDGAEKCGTSRDERVPRLFGDQTLWWVYNDKGNIHKETNGDAIGMEIRAQAFAFSTNDELNNMTFYNYEIINRSTYTLKDAFFGVWTDADLGYSYDDYVGCDVNRGLGFLYNGEDIDGSGEYNAYGAQPPAIGVDFFEGPYQDPDGIDNYSSWDPDDLQEPNCSNGYAKINPEDDARVYAGPGNINNGNINGLNFGDGIVDNERWGMRRFIYHNNIGEGNPNTTDPDIAIHYYNYLLGKWKDNTSLLYGGTGHVSSANADSDAPSDFMFPGTSDNCGWGTQGVVKPEWTEETENNPPYDRRFIQSAGPFTLEPGMINDITLGVVWARATSGGPYASVEEVKKADDKAQKLFEFCFKVVDGPDAPEVEIVELENEIIFHLYNEPSSNNYMEQYAQKDPYIPEGENITTINYTPLTHITDTILVIEDGDTTLHYLADTILVASDTVVTSVDYDTEYRFQGYQVFQLRDQDVSISDIHDANLARLVYQCDLKDDVSQLVNYEYDIDMQANIPILEVDGSDDGIQHSFKINEDKFAKGDKTLVNHRTYYYVAIAYAYNEFKKYNQSDATSIDGQKKPYLASRKGATSAIKIYEVVPHNSKPLDGGTIISAKYGDGPKITQVEGHGNASNILELTQESLNSIMSGEPWSITEAEYENAQGPINVKVVDPLKVPANDFVLKFDSVDFTTKGVIKDARWFLYNSTDTFYSDTWITLENEHIIPELGLSITINKISYPNEEEEAIDGGVLSSSVEYTDVTTPWLYFVSDVDDDNPLNWIRSGKQDEKPFDISGDDEENYEKIAGGTWAPYRFVSEDKYGLAYSPGHQLINFKYKQRLSSVDIVITPDKSLWTRCCVVEMNENDSINDGGEDLVHAPGLSGQWKFDIKDNLSVDKDGNSSNTGDVNDINSSNYIGGTGMGWFPGYAIDIETGERLNMMFGEDSWQSSENGNDMIWNPTSRYYTDLYYATGGNEGDVVLGGKHFIYILGHNTALKDNSMTSYDAGKYIYDEFVNPSSTNSQRDIYRNIMWASIPMTNSSYDFLSSEIKIKLRMANPHELDCFDFENNNPKNGNAPMYTFSTRDIAVVTDDSETGESALDLINVVPNPYYGYSEYERTQIDNIVKFTNLPERCTISIYSVNGGLIRQFRKDSELSFLDWDLKNTYGISIASGVYIIHFDAGDLGETTRKWFGSLRPIDLNSF